MGLVEEQSLSPALANEKEGGTVVVTTNPVDDRIEDPTSKSNIETTTTLYCTVYTCIQAA